MQLYLLDRIIIRGRIASHSDYQIARGIQSRQWHRDRIFRKGWVLWGGRLDCMTKSSTYLPTKFSRTELLPALWPPTTAICGRSSCICTPSCVNASCSLFTIGINCSIPALPAIPLNCCDYSEIDKRSVLVRTLSLSLSLSLSFPSPFFTTDAWLRCGLWFTTELLLQLLLADPLPPPAHARPLRR